jgi:osmotically-inducible protein OsmY
MNTNRQLLFVTSLLLIAGSSPVWGETAAPVKVTMEKVGALPKNTLPAEDQNAFIATEVRVAFRTIPGFAEDKIMIKADKGVVTLTGNVANENMKASLEKMAKEVPGVVSVKNELKVDKK